MSLRHVWAVTLKEIRHIQRDAMTLILVALSPTLLLIIMAYALTVDIKHIPLAVWDQDRSQTSEDLIRKITIGEDLDLYAQVDSIARIEEMLLREQIDVAVVIPPGFEDEMMTMSGMPLQILIDGTEPETGGLAVDHITQRASAFAQEKLASQMAALTASTESLESLKLSVRAWYNPNLRARVDLIPGLLSMVLGLPGMAVALTLAREREHGTLEQLLATPVGRGELMIGKMGPYVIGGLFNVAITTLVAVLWFAVPLHGNFFEFLGLSAIFFFALLSMGMLIGVFVPSQAGAMAVSFLLIFFPGFFLTGIFFPLVSMPDIVRMEAMFLPGSHYALITRGIFTVGIGLEILWPYALALLVTGIAFTAIAAVFFRKKLA
jgi:ABC-2 type transport system permease protein